MANLSTDSEPDTVCMLDDKPSALERTSQFLSFAGWRVRPFTHPDTFLQYARIYRPQAAIVDFRESSGQARNLLSANEFNNVIKRKCIRNIHKTVSVQRLEG
jgi:FixJ family two-component response regulator